MSSKGLLSLHKDTSIGAAVLDFPKRITCQWTSSARPTRASGCVYTRTCAINIAVSEWGCYLTRHPWPWVYFNDDSCNYKDKLFVRERVKALLYEHNKYPRTKYLQSILFNQTHKPCQKISAHYYYYEEEENGKYRN